MSDRALNGGGKEQPIEQSIVSRVSGVMRSWLDEVGQEWFGPGRPLDPIAPPATQVRSFDYPVHYNQTTQPRAYDSVSFFQLRQLAYNYDLLSGVIETRKDQVATHPWTVRVRKEEGEPDAKFKERNQKDTRVAEIRKFFNRPDREHDFGQWIRMIVEDVLVIDAPSVHPVFTFGGELYSLDVVDGATIKRCIDERGKTPEAPLVAYQQVLKGMPAIDLCAPTQDFRLPQLVYTPRNPAANRIYGRSPVEQLMMTVNIALRRQIHQLQYYTDGNIPDMIVGIPDTWTPQQIEKYETKWDAIFAGNTARRRKAKFMPAPDGKLLIHETAPEVLKDEMDEFLVRLICFFFSIQPNALVKMVNRASGQQMSEDSKDEGLSPLLRFLEKLLNRLIEVYFNAPDIEFAFEQPAKANGKEQAEIDAADIRSGVISIDERREKLGMEPLGVEPMVFSSTGEPIALTASLDEQYFQDKADAAAAATEALTSAGASASDNPDEKKTSAKPKDDKKAGGKVLKSKKKVLRASSGTFTRKMTKRLSAAKRSLTEFFHKEGKRIAKQVSEAYANEVSEKADSPAKKILADLNLDGWTEVRDILVDDLTATFAEAEKKALVDIGVDSETAVFDMIDPNAIAYAEERAAELVGMRIAEDGTIIRNPNPAWSITETTRNRIQQLVEQAITEGMTPAELASALVDDVAFSAYRAEMVARTELAMANVEGNVKGWQMSGVVEKKKWILGSEHEESGCACEDNEDQVVGLDESFESGDDMPPAHPNCVCDVIGIIAEEED